MEQDLSQEDISPSKEGSPSPEPSYPSIPSKPPVSTPTKERFSGIEGEDDEPGVAKNFDRSSSPTAARARRKSEDDDVGDDGIRKMHKFSLYETASRFYLVGTDILEQKFRILKIAKTADSGELNISEDDIVYSKKDMSELINTIDDGNKNSGGLQLRSSTWGLLGFIRFTGEYYMLQITKRSQVAILGGHYIYQIDGTELISLGSSSAKSKPERHPEEARFVGILKNLDLTRSFYFSYSYDITNTLQKNIVREREGLAEGISPQAPSFNDMFVWNHYLLEPAATSLKNLHDWCLPIIHGFVDQATLSIYGKAIFITVIARRSRFFAGARFLKRGANDLGYVANDVETEQIVSEMLTTSFHAPGPSLYTNPGYTSYVQHRGSIPLYWTQDNTGVSPKPDIHLNLVDPFYGAAALHFDNLFQRYGAPIYVLNLVKARERTPRESKLLKEYGNAIKHLNQFLPDDKKIIYTAWDMSRASKSRDQNVIRTLENIAEDVLKVTSFFRNGDGEEFPMKMQNGVARTNCIDCLDRTNAAQFVIGKLALGHQLHALGVINNTSIEYDTAAVNLFSHMYHDHGDTIAIQYGGSHLVNTMETYRRINQWTSHSRDMVESFKRYYNNSFLDGQRQEAYNLFLGNYIFEKGIPMLWDLSTDYYLHHADPRSWDTKNRRSYRNWYTTEFLEERKAPPAPFAATSQPIRYYDDYWLEYYRPMVMTSFYKAFPLRMNSTLQYFPYKSSQYGKYDPSPFRVREGKAYDNEKARLRKGVTIVDPAEKKDSSDTRKEVSVSETSSLKEPTNWLQPHRSLGILKEVPHEKKAIPNPAPLTTDDSQIKVKNKSAMVQGTINQIVDASLNPSITATETKEYERYVKHPQNLPLVTTNDNPPGPRNFEFLRYVQSGKGDVVSDMYSAEEDIADFAAFLTVEDDPLTVTEADMPKKRYKAYRQWLKGKSLFKQSRAEV